MEAVVLVIHLIVALAIIAVVLIQPSETGGFLGNSGSMSNMLAPRRSGDTLTRLTTILAGVFFLTSLSLALFAEHRGKAQSSILDVPAAEAPAATDKKAEPKKPEPAEKTTSKPAAPISK